MAIRFPTRRKATTLRPYSVEIGGSNVRRRKGCAIRVDSRRAPSRRRSSASIYTVISGSSGITRLHAHGGPALLHAAPTSRGRECPRLGLERRLCECHGGDRTGALHLIADLRGVADQNNRERVECREGLV